jgi:hypothetical protein
MEEQLLRVAAFFRYHCLRPEQPEWRDRLGDPGRVSLRLTMRFPAVAGGGARATQYQELY